MIGAVIAPLGRLSIPGALLLAGAIANLAAAAEAPAWKFVADQVSRYRITQTMEMSMDAGPGGQNSSQVAQTIDTSWTVKEIKDNGEAVLAQKIERMRMKITAADQVAEADSASKEDPQGHAAMLVPLLKAMTSDAFTLTMIPRGEIKEVKVPESILTALQNSPGAALMGEMATEAGFEKLVSQSSFAMPDQLEQGKEWTTKMESKLPDIGTQLAETTYRYEGLKEVGGKTYEAFTPTLVISFSGGDAKVEVVGQESSGEILFDREAGRLESTKLKHGMDLKITKNDVVVEQKLDQNVEMKWVENFDDEPAAEKPAEGKPAQEKPADSAAKSK